MALLGIAWCIVCMFGTYSPEFCRGKNSAMWCWVVLFDIRTLEDGTIRNSLVHGGAI